MDRRQFLSLITAAASAVTGLLLGIPLVGRLLAPLTAAGSGPSPWRAVGRLADFARGVPVRVAFPVQVQDGWVEKTTQQAAWVVRTGEQAVRVLSTVCPHLGCSVDWKAEQDEFACPCHDSGFSREGERRHGPARRGLDDLPVRVVGDVVEIRWLEFEPGLEERRTVGGAEA